MSEKTLQANVSRRVLLPETVYAVVGQETNIYFDNAVLQPYPQHFLFDVTCDHGIQHEARWFWTPDTTGGFSLAIEVRDRDDRVLEIAETTIHVAPRNVGDGAQKTLLCIGDSLTAAGIYTGELLHLSQADNFQLTLLGTQQNDAENPANRYEGYGGWKYETFTSRSSSQSTLESPQGGPASPFVFADEGRFVLDFARYLREKLDGAAPDYVTLMLGVNDVFMASEQTRASTVEGMMQHARTLFSQIRAALPAAKIGVLPLAPPCVSQDSFGETNGTMQTRWSYLKNRALANELIMREYGGREGENVYIVPAYLNLDGANHFPAIESTLNARSETKRMLFNNEVHPTPEGYRQIADGIYGWLKFLEE